jgi:hypothetical protein
LRTFLNTCRIRNGVCFGSTPSILAMVRLPLAQGCGSSTHYYFASRRFRSTAAAFLHLSERLENTSTPSERRGHFNFRAEFLPYRDVAEMDDSPSGRVAYQ